MVFIFSHLCSLIRLHLDEIISKPSTILASEGRAGKALEKDYKKNNCYIDDRTSPEHVKLVSNRYVIKLVILEFRANIMLLRSR